MSLFKALFFAALAASALSGGTLTGYIVDEPCGWNNARSTKEAKECALKCVKAGWPPVFVPDGSMKTYKITDQAKALPFVGEKVIIEGALQGESVKVEKIRKASK